MNLFPDLHDAARRARERGVINPATGLWGKTHPSRLIPIREAPGPYRGVRKER